MQECLRFNICDLQTSHLANADVPDLSSRIQQAIPDHLSYACLFWADHLLASSLASEILSALKLFIKTHFLHWLEAMSLMAVIPTANAALQMLQDISEVRRQER
jgi:TorA maturation chaperone TorD